MIIVVVTTAVVDDDDDHGGGGGEYSNDHPSKGCDNHGDGDGLTLI